MIQVAYACGGEVCKCSRQYGLVGCHESYMKISIETNDQNRNSEGEPLEFRDRSSDRVFFFFFLRLPCVGAMGGREQITQHFGQA